MTDVAIGITIASALFMIGVALESSRRNRVAIELVPSTPPSLYPRIKTDACICSGACVSACPEGDVISIVDGRPKVIRSSACVGHGDCLRSCPVSAIELVLGSTDRPVEVPIATAGLETSVSGLYVAGEVNGIGLIHNAVAQGRAAASTALEARGPHGCEFDLLVVGAGPAGIGAALEARQRGARYAVFEKADFGGAIRSYPRAKVVMTAPLDLPGIGRVKLRRTSKEALLELFEDIARRAAIPIVERAEVTNIRPITRGFRVETRPGVATAHRVILAIGRRGTPRRLGVPGDQLRHVVYDVTDPSMHAGKRVVVVGGGDSAVEVALALAANRDTDVTLVHRGRDFGRCKPDNQRALERSNRIEIELQTTVSAVGPEAVELEHGGRRRTHAASLVVCCLGAELPGAWLRALGIGLREARGDAIAH
jgi:thioredoxin reductase (NADPH)